MNQLKRIYNICKKKNSIDRSISTWKHDNHAVYQKQALLTVCLKKESWIEAENDKCGGNLSPTRLYKKPTTVLWVNIRMNISKFQGMGFVHFIYGQCLFLKSWGLSWQSFAFWGQYKCLYILDCIKDIISNMTTLRRYAISLNESLNKHLFLDGSQ